MGFFTNLRSDRLITQIKSTNEPLGAETLKSVAKLKELGPGVIEPTIQALADADKNATVALVDVLSTLVTNKTFPQFVQGLCDGGPRIAAGIAWALTSSRSYSPGLLLDALNAKGVAKSALLDVIHAQRDRFNVRELLTAAYAQEANEKAALFRIVGEIADENCHARADSAASRARTRSRACTSSTSCRGSTGRKCKRALQAPAARQQQDDPLGRAGGAGAHGRPGRRRRRLPAAARPGDRRAEPRHRCADPRQRPGDHQAPDRRC